MNKLKLKTKQKAILDEIVAQKTEISKLLNQLNIKENLVLELIFEENEVVGTIGSVRLEGEYLEYEFVPEKPIEKVPKNKKKPKELEPK